MNGCMLYNSQTATLFCSLKQTPSSHFIYLFMYLLLHSASTQCLCVWSSYMENYQLYWYPRAHAQLKAAF